MLLDFIQFENKNSGQLYQTIYKRIKEAARSGIIKKGERLPSVREAAAQLGVSRTTVENAYQRLCIEGIAESQPQRGYFVLEVKKHSIPISRNKKEQKKEIIYDFSSRRIDQKASDTELWKKKVRSVLLNSGELTSYGDNQGEPSLREALSKYAYKSRGVITTADNIIIGAGMGPLLNILCGITGRNVRVGFEYGSFPQAEGIFSDYGIKTAELKCDSNGIVIEELKNSDINSIFLMPSAMAKISVTAVSKRRNQYADWANDCAERFIIEDDYNGELRYFAHTVSAFQGKCPDKTVYIGSFSKLLLPSVRIAYMVLPPFLAEQYNAKKANYNQTCGKIEQLALCEYIESGALEKQLRRLRRLYYNKSCLICDIIEENLKSLKKIVLYESSLMIEIQTDLKITSQELCDILELNGIEVIATKKAGAIRLGFSGITEQEILPAVKRLSEILEEIKNGQKWHNKNEKIC